MRHPGLNHSRTAGGAAGRARGVLGLLAAVLIVALVGVGPAVGTPGLAVSVVDSAIAGGPIVRLADCAHFDGDVPAGLAATPLAAAPLAGQQEPLTRAQIAAVLTGAGIRDPKIGGAAACVVTTPAATIAADQLLSTATKALKAVLPPPGTDQAYVLTPMTHPDPVMVPARPWTLAPSLPQSIGLGIVTVGVRVMEDGALVRTVLIPLEIGLRAPVLVAVESLPYHTMIKPTSVRIEQRTMTNPSEHPLEDPDSVAAMWTTETIPAGAVLMARMVAPIPAVQRGSMVTVVVHRGTLWIGATGVAEDDAALGQTVSIKIESTGTVITGRVTGPDTVEVILP